MDLYGDRVLVECGTTTEVQETLKSPLYLDPTSRVPPTRERTLILREESEVEQVWVPKERKGKQEKSKFYF